MKGYKLFRFNLNSEKESVTGVKNYKIFQSISRGFPADHATLTLRMAFHSEWATLNM